MFLLSVFSFHWKYKPKMSLRRISKARKQNTTKSILRWAGREQKYFAGTTHRAIYNCGNQQQFAVSNPNVYLNPIP